MRDRIYLVLSALLLSYNLFVLRVENITSITFSILAKLYFKTAPCIMMLILAFVQITDLHLLGI